MADKIKITIDGKEKEVEAGANLLQVILDDGQLIPHFCYHEALGPAGACRLCACMIAPAADKPARLEMSCMVRAAEGMVISVNDDYAFKFRKQVIEDLMLNHPHDCPVCDEGGECMLQDMTVLSQHQHRRNRFAKKTWVNQDLGPFIHHEMNRCITCYRCVRYYRDYALGDDFGVYGSRSRVYFGRVEDGNLESVFSGNLVDVCPTGVFTDKQFREHYTRPWDLLTARSVCPSCSTGCNVLPGYRQNTLRRIKPASNEAVNKYFMCDRGRYGGEFVNSDLRLMQARVDGIEMDIDTAVKAVADRLRDIAGKYGPAAIAGLGSERATLESNAALHLLMKGLGSNRVAYFMDSATRSTVRRAASITASGEISIPTLQDMEQSDFVLILGGDLSGEAPMMDLAVRQAIKNGNPLYICSPRAGELDKFATATWRCLPGEEATIASFIGSVPADTQPADDNFVQKAAIALQKSKKPLILCSAVHQDVNLIEAAFSLAKSSTVNGNRSCRLAYFLPAMNSFGAGLMKTDDNPDTLWDDIDNGSIKALVITERDLAASTNPELLSKLQKLEFVVTIDSLETETVKASHAALPCVSHYQGFGTVVNYEGRAQAFDGMHFSSHVNLAASEVITSLIQQAHLEEQIGGTDFADVYDVTSDTSQHMDRLRTGDAGCIVRTSPKLPPAATRNQGSNDSATLKPWTVYHTFGSGELSSYSPAIAERAPEPYIEINPEDASLIKANEGEFMDLTEKYGVSGKIRFNANLSRGVIATPYLVNLDKAQQVAEVASA